MATFSKLGNIGSMLEKRISARLARYAPGDPKVKEVLTRIGVMIQAEARINIRRKRIIDTGTLFNSIQYRLFTAGTTAGVTVGSFGVPYAAAHEFGFSGPVAVRSHTRIQVVAFGRRIPARPVTVGAHTRFMQIRARPYLRPAVQKLQSQILDLIRGIAR